MSSMGSRDKIEEIKNRLDIVDVIGKDVNLKCKGDGKYVGTVGVAGHSGESLKVSQSLQSWNDFKNGSGGDVLDWIGYINGYKDVRGADFPEVLRIAADLAGVELEDMTEEERNAAKEKAEIHDLFTEAAENYHKKLTPELYDYIFQKWEITKETVDNLKIGYANTGRNLEGLDKETLKKSGMVYVNGGMFGGEVFQGRITFPYWKNGKVVYLIGRETDETPEAECQKGMKYKKLLVHKEGYEYVSPSVQNSYFYGEDSLRGHDYCIITEGVADCIAMLQAGFPCISPVTVQFRKKDHPKLISLTKGLQRVYICNDNEANQAGLKGALSTAEALESEGIETRIIELPKPEGLDKIDIADYMKEHTPDDFKELMDSSVRLWDYKLNKQVIKAGSTSLERLRAFKTFISNDIHLMKEDEWEVFVNNEVFKKFKLYKNDIKTAVAEVKKELFLKQDIATEQPEDLPDEPEDRLNRYPEQIKELAYKILKEGDPLEFILDTWNLRHVGDRNIGENCLCAVASTYIVNTRGLHVKPSGESGKGKSDSIIEVLLLLPKNKYISGSMSSKSLFYHPDLKPGTIIYSDDANFTEDMIATLKQSTSSFQEPTKHMTVVKQEYAEHLIPERCSFWFSTVDGIPEEQLANRFLNADVDGSKKQDENVYNHIKDSELNLNLPIDDDILICRCIFDILGKELYKIKIPFIKAIEWTNIENRRNFPKFLDILRSVTFFNVMQRQNINGYYLSDIEDFDRALEIYKGTSKNNATNLTDLELKVLKYIESEGSATIKKLTKLLNVSRQRVMQILHGKDGKGGMCAKVPQLNKIDQSKTDENKTTTRQNIYEYNGPKLGLEVYDTVAKIDQIEAEKEKIKFIEKLSAKSATNATQCNLSATPSKVALKTSTIERINNNATLKRKNVIQGNCDTVSREENVPVEEREKNNFLSQDENVGCMVAHMNEASQPATFNKCNPGNEGMVALGCIGCTDEDKVDPSLSELLRKDLKKYAWSDEYNGIVDNIPVFVGKFNERTPEYVQSLGLQAILYNAERLSSRGWK
ncbi:MAG TPA: CHC2 zinc finger domain-containing protein [Methanosarcina sp.]|jgi:DNA primase catalytic core